MFDFDLADRVDDLICIFDGNPDSDMDTITILFTVWITFLFFSILLVKFIYRKYKKTDQINVKKTEERLKTSIVNGTMTTGTGISQQKQSLSVMDNQVKNASNGIGIPRPRSPSPLVTKKSVPQRRQLRCSGPDPIVVDFVTAAHNWIYSGEDEERREKAFEKVNRLFLNSVNKIFHRIPHEDTFVTKVDDVSLSNDLSLQNLYAEYQDYNTIKITCDCEATFSGHLSVALNKSINAQENEDCFEFIINRLVGRLKFLINVERKVASFNFEGWPEICLAVGNTSKKNSTTTRLDPKDSEIITSKLSSAIRNATVEDLHLDELENFPILPTPLRKLKPKSGNSYLRIQLNRGVDIGLQKDASTMAYCVIELDEPPQKFQSSVRNIPNPIWNETFIFNTEGSTDCEILFEMYSSIGAVFLGCHIVSVNQIIEGRKEFLELKSRRMKVAENITGTLEVIFTLVDEHEAAKYFSQQVSRHSSMNKDSYTPRLLNEEGASSLVVTSSVSRDLDGLTWAENFPVPPKRQHRNTATKLEDQYGEERGRRRIRRGDIFTSLRRRFSKERSKSVFTNDGGPDAADLLPNSSDFVRSVSAGGGGRINGLGFDSTRSSASELSQYSGQSTSTFMHESSTLLIQCTESGVKKYYLIPPEAVGTGRWKNKKKLHIYNDHTFVAKRIPSGLSCTVCFGRFPFSLRKQGYQCRDCRLISHKECHIRIPTFCVKSTVYDIDVITI